MKKAYPIRLLPAFLLGKLYYRSEDAPLHCKVENRHGKIIAFKSNRNGKWYVKPAYRLFLSQHSLERLVRKKIFH